MEKYYASFLATKEHGESPGHMFVEYLRVQNGIPPATEGKYGFYPGDDYTKENGVYQLNDQVSWEEEQKGELREIYRDGTLLVDEVLSEIRKRIKS